jgi:plastin-1
MKKVNTKKPVGRFKQVENTNYAIMLGKHLRYSLVGIQGADIVDGNRTLTLGFVWQLMRDHIVQTLKTLSKGGHDITENDMIKWANETVKRGGKTSRMNSFKDSSLRNGMYLLDLLNGMQPGIVDYTSVGSGRTDDEAKQNANYAISIARKMGATIFVLPDDIVEVKPKMILTFVGSLMALHKQ